VGCFGRWKPDATELLALAYPKKLVNQGASIKDSTTVIASVYYPTVAVGVPWVLGPIYDPKRAGILGGPAHK